MSMETPFKNDPFAMIYQAFKCLYPDKQCEIWWEPNPPDSDEGAYGATDFPDDSGLPQVFIFSDYPVAQQAEILAHELAHVAVGVEHDHDGAWDAAFEAIKTKYERIASEKVGRGCCDG